MNASDLRKIAREKLSGKWGKAVLISFLYFAFLFAVGFVLGLLGVDSDSTLSKLVSLVLEIPLSYGYTILLMKLFNSEDTTPTSLFSLSFSNFARAWKVQLQVFLKLIVPLLIIIAASVVATIGAGVALSGAIFTSSAAVGSGSIITAVALIAYIVGYILLIIKSFYYALTSFIAIENPDLPTLKCVEKSQQLMTSRRGFLFGLELSFIGWAILAAITFGIGVLWLLPYILLTKFAFYKSLTGEQTTITVDYSSNPYQETTTNNTAEQTTTAQFIFDNNNSSTPDEPDEFDSNLGPVSNFNDNNNSNDL